MINYIIINYYDSSRQICHLLLSHKPKYTKLLIRNEFYFLILLTSHKYIKYTNFDNSTVTMSKLKIINIASSIYSIYPIQKKGREKNIYITQENIFARPANLNINGKPWTRQIFLTVFDQFTSRNPIPEFLWVRMEVERETVNFVLFGLFQFQPPTLPTLSSLHILLESRLVNTAKSVPPRPWAKIRLITFRHQFLKRSP